MPAFDIKPIRDQRNVLPAPIKALLDAIMPAETLPTPMGMAVGGPATSGARSALGTLERMIHDTQTGPIQPWMKVNPVSRWAVGHAPKQGGVLHEVLEKAATKSGMGETLTPGESGLLNQFKTWGGGK